MNEETTLPKRGEWPADAMNTISRPRWITTHEETRYVLRGPNGMCVSADEIQKVSSEPVYEMDLAGNEAGAFENENEARNALVDWRIYLSEIGVPADVTLKYQVCTLLHRLQVSQLVIT